MKKFRILSIDGGGLRGVVPLTILKKVEDYTGQPIWKSFDLIAGSSTGGLIAGALTIPENGQRTAAMYSIDKVMDVYLNDGKIIFPPRRTRLGNLLQRADDLVNPKFSDKGIESVFRKVCKDARLNDSLTNIMISTYDLTNNVPLFFKSRSAKSIPGQNILLYEACRATSAGPTYLPAFELTYPNNNEKPERLCIDGGVYVNNPSMAALSEFSRHCVEYGFPKVNNDINYEDVFVLSIGTGTYSGQITAEQAKNKGQVFWANNIADVMMRGVNRVTDYQMTEIMIDGNYLRLTINIADEPFSEMSRADSDAANYLINATRTQVTENVGEMDKLKAFLKKCDLSKSLNV